MYPSVLFLEINHVVLWVYSQMFTVLTFWQWAMHFESYQEFAFLLISPLGDNPSMKHHWKITENETMV